MSNLMTNQTIIEFLILPFSSNTNNKLIIVCIFSFIYLSGIIVNSVIIAVICLDVHLHTPMYLFFSNLSTIDICYTSVTIPKLLHIVLSGNGLLSSTQCFTQMYFFLVAAGAEEILFFVMGFDRYVAICHPLHYHQILSTRNTTLMVFFMWVFAFINSSFITIPLSNLTYDWVVILHQFFCDVFHVFNASNGGSTEFYIAMFVEWILFGLFPFFCNLLSYVKIFGVIVRITSTEGRRKTFSTCSSHLIVMMIYYTTATSHFMLSFHQTEILISQVSSALFSTVVPMINPLVYSLRNNEIRKALHKLLKIFF